MEISFNNQVLENFGCKFILPRQAFERFVRIDSTNVPEILISCFYLKQNSRQNKLSKILLFQRGFQYNPRFYLLSYNTVMRSLQGVGENNKKVARELTPKSIKELDTLHRQLLTNIIQHGQKISFRRQSRTPLYLGGFHGSQNKGEYIDSWR